MGIRFQCHHCEHELHVKDFQGGKRGRCPSCKEIFRIPTDGNPYSVDADASRSPGDSSCQTASERSSSADVLDRSVADKERSSQQVQQSTRAPLQQEVSDASGPTDVPPAVETSANADRVLNEVPDAKWYVRLENNDQFGPADAPTLKQWIKENRVSFDSLVWREGWPEWQTAADGLPEYFGEAVISESSSRSNSLAPVGPIPQNSGVSQLETQGEQLTLTQRNRTARIQRKKRNYTIMIATLFVVAITLIVALVVVLTLQSS